LGVAEQSLGPTVDQNDLRCPIDNHHRLVSRVDQLANRFLDPWSSWDIEALIGSDE
jgi:hypothetical protein